MQFLLIFASLLFSPLFFYQRYFLIGRPISNIPTGYSLRNNIGVKQIADIDELRLQERISVRKANELKRNLAQGKRCFIALKDDDIVGYSWLSFQPDADIKLPKETAFIFGDYILPNFRGKEIHAALTVERLRFIEKSKYQRVAALVSVNNTSARRAFEKIGFTEERKMVYVKIPWLNWCYTKAVSNNI
ncbi:MAG: GNAT family N-acetyltransferase [Candidatus Omnitrophota bacterium]